MEAMIVLQVMRLSHPMFQSHTRRIVEVVELQCFFNKSGALAPQSAINYSSMYVLLQTYYLEDL